MSQAGIRRTVAPRPFPMSGSRVAGRASTPRSGSLHPSRSPAPADQDRFGRLRAAILRLVGGDAGRRVAVLIADGDERLGVVADVAAREVILHDLFGQPCAIPLEMILSVQLLPQLRSRPGVSGAVK